MANLLKKFEALKTATTIKLLRELKKYGKLITDESLEFKIVTYPLWEEFRISVVYPDGTYADYSGTKYSLVDLINEGLISLNDAVYFTEELAGINSNNI